MTLKEIINAIEVTAASQPCVEQIVREDVFRINSLVDRRYGIFAWLQGQHESNVATGLNRYNFTLFYVDRLTADHSNALDVQSAGCTVLDNIVRTLDNEGIPADSFTIQPFTQRFTDECAGVFVTVTFEVPVDTLCPEAFEDGNYLLDANGLFIITSDGKKIQVL